MNPENPNPRKYKRLDESFKRSAVELWLQGSKSVEAIASELGISTQSLKPWKKQLATGSGQRSVQQLEEENRRLKRALQHVLWQREILTRFPKLEKGRLAGRVMGIGIDA